MATHTTYYNLTKPAQNDNVNIGVLNDNADIIDTALHNKVNNDDTQNITTSANKCMLSDGVTSVEDALDALKIKYAEYTGTTNASGLLEVTTIPANSIMLQIVATTTNQFCINSRVEDSGNNPRIAIMSMSTGEKLASTSATVRIYYIEVASL